MIWQICLILDSRVGKSPVNRSLTVSPHNRIKSSDDTSRTTDISDSVLRYSTRGNISINVPKRSKITALYFINSTFSTPSFVDNLE